MKEQAEEKTLKNIEIFDKISLYLVAEGLLSPAERVHFLELLQKGAY